MTVATTQAQMPTHDALVEALYDEVRTNFHEAFRGILINDQHLHTMTRDSLNPQRAWEQLRMLERMAGSINGKTILEVGSGHGLTVALARTEFGADAHGIEPGEDEFSGAFGVSQKIMGLAGLPVTSVQRATGESIPFPDAAFDVVFSSQVLEHVQIPQQVINESLRVLKPGGILHIVVPNYGSWWEGHYGVLWFPHLSKGLGKLYVKLMGRDPSFIDTLQFINHGWLARLLKPHAANIEILGWGDDVWAERIRSLGFSEWSTLARLKAIIRVVHRLKLVEPLIAIGRALHWETPIILTLRKRA